MANQIAAISRTQRKRAKINRRKKTSRNVENQNCRARKGKNA